VRTRQIHRLITATVLAALTAACSVAPPVSIDATRGRDLDEAFAAAADDPGRAASLFELVGPGPELERARFEVWADCLTKTGADTSAWREYLADRPPQDLEGRARLAIIEQMLQTGAIEAVLEEREFLEASRRPEADELLLRSEDATVRISAAQRLAVSSPLRLRRFDRDLDQRLARALSPQDHLDRAANLRKQGSPSRAAAELRTLSWRGTIEVERRRELARAELDAGAPLRALRVLPATGTAGAEDLALRAQAYRDRAWHLWPGKGERRVFDDCRTTAGRAVEAGADGAVLTSALSLALECATESGDLTEALAHWWRLEGLAWGDSRREWLGRRLGIALARRGNDAREVEAVARSIPTHRRALAFWLAETAPDGTAGYRSLSAAAIPDLYALWASDRLRIQPPASLQQAAALEAVQPPSSVERLLETGADGEAVRQWRRIWSWRSTTPAEALVAADLAHASGFPITAIRWLRAGFPELGTLDTAEAPANALAAYLPLRWRETLIAAARESRIEPWLVAAIARQESGFVAHARSPRGAVGVLQLIPSTARGHARALGLELPPDLGDPAINIRLGAREIAYLVRRFGAVEPALAAYNGGETRTRRWWRRQPDRRFFTEEVPIPETYNYIRRVTFLSEAYRLVYQDVWRSAREDR
jgi:soluble lytic murein transglycosylase